MRYAILFGALVLLSLSGCGRRHARHQAQVEEQAAAFLQCPMQHVQAEPVGGATWQVQACGAVVMLRCHRAPWVGMRCRRPAVGEVRPVLVAAPPPVQYAPPPQYAQPQYAQPQYAPPPQYAQPQYAPPPQYAQPASPHVTVTIGAAPAQPAPAAPTVVATPLEVLSVLGAPLRQCGASGVVVVRWTADGTVSTSLDGAQAGGPADACVRGLSARVRIQAPGVEGTLVQEVW